MPKLGQHLRAAIRMVLKVFPEAQMQQFTYQLVAMTVLVAKYGSSFTLHGSLADHTQVAGSQWIGCF